MLIVQPYVLPNGNYGVKVTTKQIEEMGKSDLFGLKVEIRAKSGNTWFSRLAQLAVTHFDKNGEKKDFIFYTNEREDPLLSKDHDAKVWSRVVRHLQEVNNKMCSPLPKHGERFDDMINYVIPRVIAFMHKDVKTNDIYRELNNPKRYQRFWHLAKINAEEFALEWLSNNQS